MDDELTNQSEGITQETQETQEVSQEQTQESTTTQQVETPQSIRVKYNHQELELPYEEAVTHIQKGMNFDKAVERARQEARDQAYADMGYEWKGKPITTEAEYKQAVRESELENKIRSQYANVPDDVVEEILEGKRFREQYQTQQQQLEAQKQQAQEQQDYVSRRDSMYEEYLSEFPDHTPETIPKEVWAEANKWLQSGGREGRRLADALTRHNWKQNQAQTQAAEANQNNAAASTGSVKGQGVPKGPLTEEMIENMTDKERMTRWPEIRKFYNMK